MRRVPLLHVKLAAVAEFLSGATRACPDTSTDTLWLCLCCLCLVVLYRRPCRQQHAVAATAPSALLVLLLFGCSLPSCAEAASAAVDHHHQQQPPQTNCTMTVAGFRAADSAQGIRDAAWHCSGGGTRTMRVTAAIDTALQPFAASFTGVRLDNSCSTPGCLITICGNSSVTITGSSVTSINDTLGSSRLHSVLCVTNSSHVVLQDSTMEANSVRALSATDDAVVSLVSSTIRSNRVMGSNGAAVLLDGKASLAIVNSTLETNAARAGNGGGLFISGSASAVINSSRILRNYCDALGDGGQQPTVGLGEFAGCFGGGIRAGEDSKVVISGDTVLEFNFADAGGGIAVTDRASLAVDDTVLFGSNRVVNQGRGFDVFSDVASLLELPSPDFEEQGFVGPVRVSKCSKGVVLERTPCGVGEQSDARRGGFCFCCPERSYSFNTSSNVCLPCPANAQCPGGFVVQPLPGFWRASEWSDQVHKCPLSVDACAGNDRCKPGYQGALCAACQAPGYGIVSPLRCGRCMAPRTQLGLYILIALVTVFFVAVTVHFTWHDNLEGSNGLRPSDIIKVLVQFLQFLVIIGSVSVPWPDWLRSLFRVSSVVFGAASGQALSLDCWMSHYKPFGLGLLPRAMQLQLFTILAPLLVFAAVCLLALLWWGLRRLPSAAAAHCGSCCNPPHAEASYGRCCTPRAFCTRVKPVTFRQLLRKLPVTALIVAFYAYPSLLRASLSFFACLRVDAPPADGSIPLDPDGNPVRLLSHPHGYSILDIQQACFVGWHRGWALGLGIPAVLITCLGVPLGLLWLLKAKAASADDPAFREHWGFLYRNYKQDKLWWEAVWAGQMVLLSLVAAFHFKLEAYYSMLMLCLIFVVGAALQSLFKPYSVAKLHQVHYASFACLFLTCLAALVNFDKSAVPLTAAHTTIAVLVVAMDVGFILYSLWAVFATSREAMASWCRSASVVVGGPLGRFMSQAMGPTDSASSQPPSNGKPPLGHFFSGVSESRIGSGSSSSNRPPLEQALVAAQRRVPPQHVDVAAAAPEESSQQYAGFWQTLVSDVWSRNDSNSNSSRGGISSASGGTAQRNSRSGGSVVLSGAGGGDSAASLPGGLRA